MPPTMPIGEDTLRCNTPHRACAFFTGINGVVLSKWSNCNPDYASHQIIQITNLIDGGVKEDKLIHNIDRIFGLPTQIAKEAYQGHLTFGYSLLPPSKVWLPLFFYLSLLLPISNPLSCLLIICCFEFNLTKRKIYITVGLNNNEFSIL